MKNEPSPELSIQKITRVIQQVLPGKELNQVIDRGAWVRHNFELVFRDGSRAFMKIQVQDEWLDSTINEARLSEVLRNHGLPGPKTLYVDSKGKYLGLPFIIQSELKGIHLSEWMSTTAEKAWPTMFEAVGEAYRKIHAIKGHASGVWINGPENTLPVSPNDFYLKSEIKGESGKAAFESGYISEQDYLKIQSLWEENLSSLKEHTPSLVHSSPFPWTICLLQDGEGGYEISRLCALGDFLWWDPAYDISFLLFPPGYAWPEECKEALAAAYGQMPEKWRINLYGILQHLCELNGVYMAPSDEPGPRISKEQTKRRLKNLLGFF